jgi:hypothetical protein
MWTSLGREQRRRLNRIIDLDGSVRHQGDGCSGGRADGNGLQGVAPVQGGRPDQGRGDIRPGDAAAPVQRRAEFGLA